MEITEDIQNGTTNFVFYLGGDAYSAPAIWKEIHHSNAQPLDAQLYFLHRDHLGSIVMITDAAGNLAEKRQFDAWGNLVKLENGNSVPLTAFVILDRGYTGHSLYRTCFGKQFVRRRLDTHERPFGSLSR